MNFWLGLTALRHIRTYMYLNNDRYINDTQVEMNQMMIVIVAILMMMMKMTTSMNTNNRLPSSAIDFAVD